METKQLGNGIVPRWAVRLKKELKETRKEYALETSRKQVADLFIAKMGLWDDFKTWRTENTELKNDPVPSIFDEINRFKRERDFWIAEYKKMDEKVEFWRKDADWWNGQVMTMLDYCNYWIEECKKLSKQLSNKEA